MTLPEQRLAELGLTLPEVPTPAGAYVPAVRTGQLVFTAGQIPLSDGRVLATGKVGDGDASAVTPARAKELAAVCVLNALAAVKALVGDLSQVSRVVKVVGFVASEPSFSGQPGVVDGASELLVDVFGDAGRHARSAVGVAALPRDVPVEVEIVVELAARPGFQQV